jgi:hypothetical protein
MQTKPLSSGKLLFAKDVKAMYGAHYVISLLTALLLFSFLICGCSTTNSLHGTELPPVLAPDELTRPYTRLGRIQVTRETYGADYSLTPDIKLWGFTAVRQEAVKMNADAVVFVEVTGGTRLYGLIPSTEYRASGIAIKFK